MRAAGWPQDAQSWPRCAKTISFKSVAALSGAPSELEFLEFGRGRVTHALGLLPLLERLQCGVLFGQQFQQGAAGAMASR